MGAKKKILCIGDSLALPGHLNKYEDTWFYKLKQNYPSFDFISFFKRQLTTDVLVTMGGGEGGVDNWPKGADCFEAFMPDVIILQLGIVDCAPRLLNTFDKIVIKILPNSLVKIYISIIKKVGKRSINNTLVPFKKFKSNLCNYIDRIKKFEKFNTSIIIISISIPDQTMVLKNKYIMTNVKRYNEVYKEVEKQNSFVTVLPPLQANDYKYPIYEDGYHPNPYGNILISNMLLSKMK